MPSFIIEGGHRLKGEIIPQGAKNEALQVLCAVLLMIFVIRGCARNRKWWPAALTVLLLGVSAFFQFFRDSKIEFIFNEGWEWVQENADSIAIVAYILISAALIPTALSALRRSSRRQEKKI